MASSTQCSNTNHLHKHNMSACFHEIGCSAMWLATQRNNHNIMALPAQSSNTIHPHKHPMIACFHEIGCLAMWLAARCKRHNIMAEPTLYMANPIAIKIWSKDCKSEVDPTWRMLEEIFLW